MIEKETDFWIEAETANAIVCTINQVLKSDGTLVMGAGIAKDFAEKFEWLPDRWGIRTDELSYRATPEERATHTRSYPFVDFSGYCPSGVSFILPLAVVGIHTKLDWRDPSPIWLVDRSIKQLYIIARAMDWKKIVMTRPGCGNGGLSWERQVKPIMELVLDDRFTVVHN